MRIPKRKIAIFTGVSGSGKSSIVFDTIVREAQRLPNENFSLFVRNFLPRYPQPEADAIENLSMASVVVQKRLGGDFHSTVGTVTDIYSILRRLFWRRVKTALSTPHADRRLGLDSGRRLGCRMSGRGGERRQTALAVDNEP